MGDATFSVSNSSIYGNSVNKDFYCFQGCTVLGVDSACTLQCTRDICSACNGIKPVYLSKNKRKQYMFGM